MGTGWSGAQPTTQASPLSMGNALRLTGEGSATSLHSRARALVHALKTRLSTDAAPYLNQAWATYPGEMSELDAALHLLHPPHEDLEVEEVTIFVEGAGAAPPRPRPTNLCTTDQGQPPRTSSCATQYLGSPPGAPLSRWPPTRLVAGPTHTCPTPSPGPGAPTTEGTASGKSARAPSLLPLVVAIRGDAERVLGATPTYLYGAATLPRPLLPAPKAPNGVHIFLRTQELTAVKDVHLVRLPPATLHDPRGPRALSPALDWELWRSVWAEWLAHLPPQSRWMTTGP